MAGVFASLSAPVHSRILIRSFMRAVFGLLFLASAPAAASAPPVPLPQDDLTRSKPWEINYQDGSCNLLTTFGTGKDAVILRLTRTAPSETFELTMLGDRFETDHAYPKLAFAFGPDGPMQSPIAVAGDLAGTPLVMASGRFGPVPDDAHGDVEPQVTPEQEDRVDWMDFNWEGTGNQRLILGGMGQQMAAMRTCIDDLVRSWGYDPANPPVVRAKPQTSPATWISPHDFPLSELRRGTLAVLAFRLDVDPAGKITGCTILDKTVDRGLGYHSCKKLRAHAKLEPARDAGGVAVKDYYASRVRWLTGDPNEHRLRPESQRPKKTMRQDIDRLIQNE
jgi:hypothetical protein